MKKAQLVSLGVLVFTLVLLGVHFLAASLPDWFVRLDGMVMVLGLVVLVFSTVRNQQGRK